MLHAVWRINKLLKDYLVLDFITRAEPCTASINATISFQNETFWVYLFVFQNLAYFVQFFNQLPNLSYPKLHRLQSDLLISHPHSQCLLTRNLSQPLDFSSLTSLILFPNHFSQNLLWKPGLHKELWSFAISNWLPVALVPVTYTFSRGICQILRR